MSTGVSVTLADPTNVVGSQRSALFADVIAAAEDWIGWFIGTGTIDISITIAPTTRANGGAATSVLVGQDGYRNVWEPGTIAEMLTGVDPNGATPDVNITIDPSYFATLWLDSDPQHPSSIPYNKIDGVSLFRHELGHSFGFNGWHDPSTGALPSSYESTWDKYIQTHSDGTAWFVGPYAEAVYGGPVEVTTLQNGQGYDHLGNSLTDRDGKDLMNGIQFNYGTSYQISQLDLAILKDTGVHIAPLWFPAVASNDFGWAQGWGAENNPRLVSDIDHNGSSDYLAFGSGYTLLASGGTWYGQGPLHAGLSSTTVLIHDFGSDEGYTAAAQRGAALAGYGVAEVVYGQGYAGIYWYGATTAALHEDGAGKSYQIPSYETAPHLYGQFGSQQGWTVHNGFEVVKVSSSDTFASILGFGNDGVIVGPQAFGPGASASQSYLVPTAFGNASGWDQVSHVRTFVDDKGGAIDLNHDGITDFIGMGSIGLVFAYGTEDASHHYGLGSMQLADLGAGPDLGTNQGWSNQNTLRMIVHDSVTGFDDIIAFGAQGVFVAMGQDPATHGGQPFGPMYLAMANLGSNQGWSNALTPRLVGDVNGDGTPDLVGFGANDTFTADGSRDKTGKILFGMDSTKTIADFGYNEGWDTKTTIRELADVTGTGHDSLVLSGAFGTHVWDLA